MFSDVQQMTPAERHERLTTLHRYNGWNLLFLVITGILLFTPGLRATLALWRVPIKYAHIGSGLLSLWLLVRYLPYVLTHWQRLGTRVGQRLNVVLLLGLLAGWGITGVLIWQNRYLPAGLSQWALRWHDLLTWWALPWGAIHAVTRYFKIRFPLPAWWVGRRDPAAAPVGMGGLTLDRRTLLGAGAVVAGALLWGKVGDQVGLVDTAGGGLFAPLHPVQKEPGSQTAAVIPTVDPATERLFPSLVTDPTPVSQYPDAMQLPGGGLKGRFRIYTVTAEVPRFDPATYKLTISGLVDHEVHLNWQQILSFPRVTQVCQFHCVTGWSVRNITYEGIRLAELLDRVGVKPDATHVKFTSFDGIYTDALPLDVVLERNVLIPYLMEGAPIPAALGGPIRLFVPDMYTYKSVKWLAGIELLNADHEGFWEVRGYPNDAWIQNG